MLDLSIIIVNWKSVEYLRKCLRSIYQGEPGISLEIIVVDNASNDNCREILLREFQDVRCICLEKNLGFAGANNVGFRHSTGRYILFLNPDTEIVGSALSVLKSALDADPIVGLVGAKLLNSDLSIQTSCLQAFPTVLNQIFDAEFLRNAFPRARLWGNWPLFESDPLPRAVDVVSGACMMLPRDVFEKIGHFSNEYFMYSEDVDLCLRIHKAGLRSCYVGSAVVVHHGGKSSSQEEQSGFANVLLRESRLRLLKIWRGRGYSNLYRASIACVALCRVTLLGIMLVPFGARKRRALLSAAKKWLRILRWALGMEAWARRLRPAFQSIHTK